MTTEQLNADIRDHLEAKGLPATDDAVEQFKADFIRLATLKLAQIYVEQPWRQPSACRD